MWCKVTKYTFTLSTTLRYFYFTGVFPIFGTFTSTPLHLRGKYCTCTVFYKTYINHLPYIHFGHLKIADLQAHCEKTPERETPERGTMTSSSINS